MIERRIKYSVHARLATNEGLFDKKNHFLLRNRKQINLMFSQKPNRIRRKPGLTREIEMKIYEIDDFTAFIILHSFSIKSN